MAIACASAWFCLLLIFLNLVSTGIARSGLGPGPRPFRRRAPPPGPPWCAPFAVSIISAKRHWNRVSSSIIRAFEIIFCVARASDPVLPLVERLIARHPGRPARGIVGDEQVSPNPKLNNCVRGWDAARYDWIILADANVLMPNDAIQRLLASGRSRTGLVCSMPLGSRPRNLRAELECSFLSTFEVRWQYCAEAVGLGFAQGKTMLWRREVMDKGGGIRALGAEIADDAASTKLVRRQGLSVSLVCTWNQPRLKSLSRNMRLEGEIQWDLDAAHCFGCWVYLYQLSYF
jgi:ceramide glucosyltransferase